MTLYSKSAHNESMLYLQQVSSKVYIRYRLESYRKQQSSALQISVKIDI